jgi:ABC-type polysaccharide/polyol phosphate transport system ATPase subunit
MQTPIIEVDHVTKEFRLGQFRSLKQSAIDAFARLRGAPPPERAPFTALDDINFKVEQGEVLGIIGHNGAGKSTLLKLLAGVSRPSKGSIAVRGKVAPLIEVGAGFVPDLTGRENVFLNACILGLKRPEIARKFDEIVAFAELEEFIDTPIKRYSSGMQIKLAFSVATSIPADVLIIDEVLAVGDLAFQRKCFSRMDEIIQRSGVTVLLVSHNIRQVERLCTRTILLERGRIVEDGRASAVCETYYSNMNRIVLANARTTAQSGVRVKSSGEAEILDVRILDASGGVVESITSGERVRIRIQFRLHTRLERPEFHVGTHTTDFIYVTGSSSALMEWRPDLEAGIHEVTQTIDSYHVKPGTYCVRFAILDKHRRVVYHGETLYVFGVLPRMNEALQDELRMIDIPVSWTIDGREPLTRGSIPSVEAINAASAGAGKSL